LDREEPGVASPSVDDVVYTLAERIGGQSPGSRLPSCRRLAEDLGSNPSTVNRALHRLALGGLVRSEPRRGTFVTARAVPARVSDVEVVDALVALVRWGRAGGVPVERIDRLFREVVQGGAGAVRVGFVECNTVDATDLAAAVTNATGVTLKPVLLDDMDDGEGWPDAFDVLASPLYHLADIKAKTGSLDRVVEVVVLPSTATMRRLATVEPSAVVTVVSPTDRGLVLMTAIARQHFAGEVRPMLVPGDGTLPDPSDIDVLLYNAATRLTPEAVSGVPSSFRLEWELDASSAASFPARVEAVAKSLREQAGTERVAQLSG
jgi:DNA-binding transcriptional regulator YhcF (GntR family)